MDDQEETKKETGYYYDLAYTYDWLTIMIPFVIASGIFYLTYLGLFKKSHHRIRTKRLVAK